MEDICQILLQHLKMGNNKRVNKSKMSTKRKRYWKRTSIVTINKKASKLTTKTFKFNRATESKIF